MRPVVALLLCAGAFGQMPEWERAARQRIETIRKAPITIEVRDPAGKPIPDAPVRVRMTRHAFGWGSAVAAQMLLADTPASERYRQFILANFNIAVLENDLKWPQWEQDRERALAGVQWLRTHDIRVRGHNLVWPGAKWLPKDIPALLDDPAALRRRVMDHIRDEATATRGLLVDWDVLNEPYTNHDVQDVLGAAEMAAWFKQAREYDPQARLFLNDFSILSAGGNDTAHQDHFFETLQFLIARGAPLDGIGMQGHFSTPTPPGKMLAILDRFATLGKPIAITEFDFKTKDEPLQARFTRELLITAFSHPSIDSFLMWGFWEGRHWIPDGAMLRRDWSEKPNYQVWRDFVFKEWWTDLEGRTDVQGRFTTTGFLGAYQIETPAAPPVTLQLAKPGARVSLTARL